MAIGVESEHLSSKDEETSLDSDSVSEASASKRLHVDFNTTHIGQLSFDPMDRAVTKRRLPRRSSNSSSETGHTYSDSGTKSSAETQDDEYDIRKDAMPTTTTERKLYADLPNQGEDKMSPDVFLKKLVYATCGIELEPKKAKTLENFFAKVTDKQIAAYTMAVVSACRTNDLDALKKLHSEEGQMMNCFNRFGESLLTMACRRGFEDIVEYLLQSPDVDVRISDDSGRTVLHDACWNPSPQLKICKWIMARDPSLWFIADNRGCTPFQYARPEHWGIWRQFLLDNQESLQGLTKDDVKAKLSKA